MSSGSKRDAQEAFGQASADAIATQQRQKKQKASRRRSKNEQRQHESPKHTRADHELQQTARTSPVGPSSSTKEVVEGVSQPTSREETEIQNGDGLIKHESSTPSRREERKMKKSQNAISVFPSEQTNIRANSTEHSSEMRKHSRKSSGKEREQLRTATVTSQGAVPPVEQHVPEKKNLSPSKSAAKSQEEGSLSDAYEDELGQAKLSRRELKKMQKQQQKTNVEPTKSVALEKRKEHTKPKKDKRDREQQRQQIATRTHTTKLERPTWILSPATGGTFIDHDPVLTPDEQTLILATDREILIYATKTSLLVRKLNIVEQSPIKTYALTLGDRNALYVGLENGNIYKYDWNSGRRLWHFKLRGSLESITPTSTGPDGDNLLIVHSNEGDGQTLSIFSLNTRGEETSRKFMISRQFFYGNVKFSADLGIVVICTTDSAFVGKIDQKADGTDLEQQWSQISFPSSMTCFDAQISPPLAATKSGKQAKFATVNIAVGLTSGEIHLYNDVLNQGMASTPSQPANITTRRLHWHRTAPLSVKFSPDSNYLVSGGDETVLVIWQLDTNQKQVLPHLTTPILNLTISHQGSAYALRLADNSVMVLSTADLQPFANVNGLALSVSSETLHQPAVLHPNHTDRLLLTHSLRALRSERNTNHKSSTMLQTYDIGSQIQLGSQALARNLVSVVTTGPQGQPLQEPDVTHLDISYDGRWLASVDQWSPNHRDLDEMFLSRGDNSGRSQNHECYLRLWASTSMKQGNTNMNEQWELNTRIDEAIIESEWLHEGSKTLAIVFSPIRYQLAVANSNGHLKIYSPKARMRSGLPIKDQEGNQLFTWTCDHEIPLGTTEISKTAQHAALAFSEDGSVLAACWTSKTSGSPRVHLIDAKLGVEATSLPNLMTPDQPMIAFYRQYLISLSRKLCIFDTVNAQPVFEFDLSSEQGYMPPKMAIDVRNGTLAMSIDSAQHSSRLLLFDIRSGKPNIVYDKKVAVKIAVLLADKANGGFVIVRQDAKIARLSAPGQQRELTATTDVVASKALTNGIEHIFGSGGQKQIKDVAESRRDDFAGGSSQRRTLEDVFRFDTTAQAPSAKDLFTQVARAVAGRSE